MIYRSTPRYLCWFLWKIKPYYKFISFTDVLGLAFLLILSSFFSPALLRYDGHITFCQFKVYDKHTIPNNSWSEVAQLCPTLCNPMDCSLQGSSFHGIFQARVLEWVAISFSRGSSQPRDQTQVSRIIGRCFIPFELPGKSYTVV